VHHIGTMQVYENFRQHLWNTCGMVFPSSFRVQELEAADHRIVDLAGNVGLCQNDTVSSRMNHGHLGDISCDHAQLF